MENTKNIYKLIIKAQDILLLLEKRKNNYNTANSDQ